jgi:hypothetical protein
MLDLPGSPGPGAPHLATLSSKPQAGEAMREEVSAQAGSSARELLQVQISSHVDQGAAAGQNLYTDQVGGYRPPHTPWSGMGQAHLWLFGLVFSFFFFLVSFFCFLFFFLFSVLFIFFLDSKILIFKNCSN